MRKTKAMLIASLCMLALCGCKADDNNNQTNDSKQTEAAIQEAEKICEGKYLYLNFSDSYISEDNKLHINPQGKESTVIDDSFEIYTYGINYVIYTNDNNSNYREEKRFIVVGSTGDIFLDTKYTGKTCFISNDEFCVEELIDSKKVLSRYKITADKAEQVWSIDVEQVCGEKVNYSNSNIHQAVYASEDTYYVINLTDGSKTFTYKTADGLLSLKGEDIYVYNDILNAEENFLETYDSKGNKKFSCTFEKDESVELVSNYNYSNTFVVKKLDANGEWVSDIMNTSGEVLATSKYNYSEENFLDVAYVGNVAAYSDGTGSRIVVANNTVYEVENISNREQYAVFEDENGKQYILILETGAVKEYTDLVEYNPTAGYGYMKVDNDTDKKIVFFDSNGNDIYEYSIKDKEMSGSMYIFNEYYNGNNCSYTHCQVDGKVVIILPYEKKAYEFDKLNKEDSIAIKVRFMKNRYLVGVADGELYTIDAATNEVNKILKTEGDVVVVGHNIIEIADRDNDKEALYVLK